MMMAMMTMATMTMAMIQSELKHTMHRTCMEYMLGAAAGAGGGASSPEPVDRSGRCIAPPILVAWAADCGRGLPNWISVGGGARSSSSYDSNIRKLILESS